jgi:hypothetical protein
VSQAVYKVLLTTRASCLRAVSEINIEANSIEIGCIERHTVVVEWTIEDDGATTMSPDESRCLHVVLLSLWSSHLHFDIDSIGIADIELRLNGLCGLGISLWLHVIELNLEHSTVLGSDSFDVLLGPEHVFGLHGHNFFCKELCLHL